jgi:hypothetical protein
MKTNVRRIIRFVILLITIGLSLYVYYNDFDIKRDDLENALNNHLGYTVDIVLIEPVYDAEFILFENNGMYGYIKLFKGMNGKYQFGTGHYKRIEQAVDFHSIPIKQEPHLIIFGHIDGVELEVHAPNQSLTTEITSDPFVMVEKTSIGSDEINQVFVDGEEVSYTNKFRSDLSVPSKVAGKMQIQTFMLIFLIVVFGLIGMSYFAPKENLLERWFYKKTPKRRDEDLDYFQEDMYNP